MTAKQDPILPWFHNNILREAKRMFVTPTTGFEILILIVARSELDAYWGIGFLPELIVESWISALVQLLSTHRHAYACSRVTKAHRLSKFLIFEYPTNVPKRCLYKAP